MLRVTYCVVCSQNVRGYVNLGRGRQAEKEQETGTDDVFVFYLGLSVSKKDTI